LEPREYLYERHEPRVVEGGGIHGSSIRRPLPLLLDSFASNELGEEGFDAAAITREGRGRGFVLGL
jgi:hypothetical protein